MVKLSSKIQTTMLTYRTLRTGKDVSID